jgi:hypothetical protein
MAHTGGGIFRDWMLRELERQDPNGVRETASLPPSHPTANFRDRLTKKGGYAYNGSYTNVFDNVATYNEKDSFLEAKSRLYIRYPDPVDPEGAAIQIILPFYEDPIIRERKQTRYATYNPIGRASNLYTYLGSNSREFDLQFSITLPHLIQMHISNENRGRTGGIGDVTNHTMQTRFFPDGIEEKIMQPGVTPELSPQSANYFNKMVGQWLDVINNAHAGITDNTNMSAAVRKGVTDLVSQGIQLPKSVTKFAKSLIQNNTTENAAFLADVNTVLLENKKGLPLSVEGTANYVNKKNGIAYKHVQRIMDIVAYWVEVIRSTTYNDVQNPVYGPPTVLLEHGILYRRIPCLVDNYSIEFDAAAGYEKDTLLPRRISVNMSLKENRVGDFGVFKPTNIHGIEGNNLAGYEAVIGQDGGSLDVLPANPNQS